MIMNKLLKWRDVFPSPDLFKEAVETETNTVLSFGFEDGILTELYKSMYIMLDREYKNRYWRYTDKEDATENFIKLWITSLPKFLIDIAYLDDEFWQSLYDSEQRIARELNETTGTSNSTANTESSGNATSTSASNNKATNNTATDGAESTTPYNVGTGAGWVDGKDVPSLKNKTIGNTTTNMDGKTTENSHTSDTGNSTSNSRSAGSGRRSVDDFFINILKIRGNEFDFHLREFMSSFASLFVKFYTLNYKEKGKGVF